LKAIYSRIVHNPKKRCDGALPSKNRRGVPLFEGRL